MKIKIDLRDVIIAGSVEAAIIAFAEDSEMYASGVVGPSFSTSGPGSGWSKEHEVNDFAERALDDGAMYYIDSRSGQVAIKEDDDTASFITWTDESEVELICPSIEDALDDPDEAAEMVRSVIEYHGPRSNKKEWRRLVEKIKKAAEAFSDIEQDDI